VRLEEIGQVRRIVARGADVRVIVERARHEIGAPGTHERRQQNALLDEKVWGEDLIDLTCDLVWWKAAAEVAHEDETVVVLARELMEAWIALHDARFG
jgi:hypothetical protein